MKLYEKMFENENLSWCKPIRSKNGRVFASITEGAVSALRIDEVDYLTKDKILPMLKTAAKISNPDYGDYSDWDDFEIMMDAAAEMGCSACPWRDECDAMDCDDNDE